ncbi:hypothetical protein VE04_08380, partial [Pseudogymnoascus sp. 24MN13]
MSDSTPKDLSFPHYTLEDTPSTRSTLSIKSSANPSTVSSSLRQKSSPLITGPVKDFQRARFSLACSLAAGHSQINTPLADPPELVFPRATLPGHISLPRSPLEPTLRKLIFSRGNPLSTDLFEIDIPEPSERPMTSYTNQHLHLPHPGDLHSIFFRAFHSPWSGIGRRLALAIRGFISLYMTVTFIMVVAWQARTEASVSMVLFKFETISFFWQVAYSWITFTWALVHLVPLCQSGTDDHGFMDSLKIAFRYPLTDQWRQLFSIIYTRAVSLPNVVALVYWTIVVPHDVVDVGDLFNNGDLQSFCVLNLYFISLVVALIEIFFLSSIKPPGPFFVHILWFSAIGVAYYVWAFLGHIVTGNYVYFFLDPEQIGEENVAVGLIAFVALLNIFYGVAYGMSGARDAITGPLEILGTLQLPT